jgi:hypothetical protein
MSRRHKKPLGNVQTARLPFHPVTGVGRSVREQNGTWSRTAAVAVVLVLTSVALVPLTSAGVAGAAAGTPTVSYYEQGAWGQALYLQGEQAGQAGAQGVAILDFGRPASDGTSDGTESFAGSFLSFVAISQGVQNYIAGYYNYAPADTTLDVAVGTNDSCGVDQPCGSIVCGCPDEPESYIAWGQELADVVKQLGAWSAGFASENGYTDTVRAVAADDAEPAFDPGYDNTYDLMEGYAESVGGSYPPMIDYGSADPGIWSQDQLLQIANGFSPNVAMPEMYNATQIGEWAHLVAYAKASYGEDVTVFGVMTDAAGAESPQDAVARTLGALSSITGQGTIVWVSAITH